MASLSLYAFLPCLLLLSLETYHFVFYPSLSLSLHLLSRQEITGESLKNDFITNTKNGENGKKHPLDPLSFEEIVSVKEILINAKKIEPEKAQVRGVVLQEPPKSVVLGWREGFPLPPRKAYVVTYKDKKVHKIIVDMDKKVVEKDEIFSGSGMPLLTAGDWALTQNVSLTYPPFQSSLIRRKIPIENVTCVPMSLGWYNKTKDEGRRVCSSTCFINTIKNYYALPIEGIVMHVDLDAKEVYRFSDRGSVPGGDISWTGFTADEIKGPLEKPFKPISMEQPQGVNFNVDGNTISWAKWKFHVGPDFRAGMKISRVTYEDTVTETVRDIIYQAHLSEMFVPYQDPSESWYSRTFMDVGEYGFGFLSSGLIPLNDCPKNSYYIDGVFPDPNGNPYYTPNLICIFERYSGDVVWRHTEPLGTGAREVRPKVTLVARQVATVGNYDYTIDWEFQTDGLIRVTVTMSGMVAVKSVFEKTLNDVENEETLFGTFVNDHTVAVAHDHFINFRLDMDVDGPENSFLKAKLVTRKLSGSDSSARKSIWDVKKIVPETELEGQYNVSAISPSEFFVFNEKSKTRLGNKRSYKLVPRSSGVPMMSGDDFPQIRAAWCKNSIWVTPHNESEKWAGGEFPNQSQGDDTLATWTLKDRSIVSTDIVVWYTVAYHHWPVQEDFPVMPSTLGGFDIKPANFFEANPAIRAQSFTENQMPSCSKSSKRFPLNI